MAMASCEPSSRPSNYVENSADISTVHAIKGIYLIKHAFQAVFVALDLRNLNDHESAESWKKRDATTWECVVNTAHCHGTAAARRQGVRLCSVRMAVA